MCYSALVQQDCKKLGIRYQARIDLDEFGRLFQDRLDGSAAKISKALEASLLKDPKTADERRIAKLIRDFRALELADSERELFAQSKRLADAERTLLTKVTKKAQNDQRIAGDKIEKLKARIQRLQSEEVRESDSRIFPGQYAPLVLEAGGERVIRPYRYLLRPRGQKPEFDRKFDGCYNARRDSLAEVFWWKSVFGRHHGILTIESFWEHVKRDGENVVLRFDPRGLDELMVPCIFDRNEEGDFVLDSFALITDEPNPEVKAAGHDRTPIVMKEEHFDLWLKTGGRDLAAYETVFNDKQKTYFEHEVAA